MKKYFKICSVCLLIALTLFLFGGCGEAKPKDFTCSAGLTITLTDKFYEGSKIAYTMYAESSDVLFVAQKESFENLQSIGIDENSTLMQYARAVISSNTLLNITPQEDEENNLTYFDYEKTSEGRTFHYYAVVAKGSDAFWLCQFICEARNTSSLKPTLVKYAKSITVI